MFLIECVFIDGERRAYIATPTVNPNMVGALTELYSVLTTTEIGNLKALSIKRVKVV